MIEINPKTKILVVSADPENALAIKLLLKKVGLTTVTECDSGIEALKLAMKDKFELILCDQNTRFLSGWLFVQEFKTSARILNTAVVLLGKEAGEVPPAELKQFGVPGYLQMPCSLKDLMHLVSVALTDLTTSGTTENQYTNAKFALVNEKHDEAVNLYESLRRATNNSNRSSVGLAQALEKKEDFTSAEAIVAAIAPGSGGSISALLLKLRLAARSGNQEDAAKIVDALLKATATSPLYFLSCLDLCLSHEFIDLAEKICARAKKQGFNMPEFVLGQAKVLYARHDAAEALKMIRRLTRDFGETLESLNLEGVCMRKMANYDGAKTAYEKALKLSPMDSKLFFNLALTAIAMHDTESAIRHLETCVKISPHFAKAREKLEELVAARLKVGA